MIFHAESMRHRWFFGENHPQETRMSRLFLWAQDVESQANVKLELTLGTLRFRNDDAIRTMVVSPSGKLLASAGGGERGIASDYSICVWNMASGELVKKLVGHQDVIASMSFVNEEVLLSCSLDATLREWRISTPLLSGKIHEDKKKLTCMTMSPGQKHLAIGRSDGSILIWDVGEYKATVSFGVHTGLVKGIAWSPNGRLIASVGDDKVIQLSSSDGKRVSVLAEDADCANAILFSPDSRKLAFAGGNQKNNSWIRLYDLYNSRPPRALSCKKSPATSIVFSPDGKELLGSFDDSIGVLDASSLQSKTMIATGTVRGVNSLAMPAQGRLIAAGNDGFHRFYDMESGKLLNPIVGHRARCLAVAFSNDDKALWSSCSDGTIIKWDLRKAAQEMSVSSNEKHGSLAISVLDNNSIAASFSDESIARIECRSGRMQTKSIHDGNTCYTLTRPYAKNRILAASLHDVFKINIGFFRDSCG